MKRPERIGEPHGLQFLKLRPRCGKKQRVANPLAGILGVQCLWNGVVVPAKTSASSCFRRLLVWVIKRSIQASL